jgi:hypothetical protein
MKMKLIGSFLVASMLLFLTAFAHGDKLTPQEKAAKKTAWMKANLGLSDEQVKQVEPLNLAYAQKNYDLKNNQALSKEEREMQMKKNDDEKDAKLKAIFSAEQFKTYEAKKMEMKAEMKKHSEGGGGAKNG